MDRTLLMFKISYKSIIASAAVAMIGMSSCQKESMQMELADYFATESETESNSSEISSSEEVDMLSMRSRSAMEEESGCNPLDNLPDCASVTESSESFPKTITIDFGTGCEDQKGRSKEGKIIIDLSAAMDVEGSVRTVTFENFKVGPVHIDGERKLINKGKNDKGNYVFEKTVHTTHSGERGERTRSFEGQMELISGLESDDCNKVFYLSGKGTMTCDRGEHTKTITTPLLIDRSCKHPKSGVVEMSGRKDVVIDFGAGECDNLATVTKDGETKEIDLDEARVRGKKGGKLGG